MCGSTTKQHIGAALRQLMGERPFDKITVQNLMDETCMKRQSFYYHFRDTRDVLLWLCRQELLEPLGRSELAFPEWYLLALDIVEKDRPFYRRAAAAANPEFVRMIGAQVLSPRVTRLFYGDIPETELDANQRFVTDFFIQAILGQFLRFVSGRTPLDRRAAREQIDALLAVLRSRQR